MLSSALSMISPGISLEVNDDNPDKEINTPADYLSRDRMNDRDCSQVAAGFKECNSRLFVLMNAAMNSGENHITGHPIQLAKSL